MSKMDAARRDLLAAVKQCSPHVRACRDVLDAVSGFASLQHVPEEIEPRDFGVDWRTPAKK